MKHRQNSSLQNKLDENNKLRTMLSSSSYTMSARTIITADIKSRVIGACYETQPRGSRLSMMSKMSKTQIVH